MKERKKNPNPGGNRMRAMISPASAGVKAAQISYFRSWQTVRFRGIKPMEGLQNDLY